MKHFEFIVLLTLPISVRAEDWGMYLRDAKHSSFASAESTITRDNASGLRPAWTFQADGPIASGVTVVDGTLYFGDWTGSFYAVNAADGALVWRAFVGMAAAPQDPACFPAVGVTSQAAVSGDTVYVGGGDSAVYAFDRVTGAPRWRIPLADPDTGAYLWSSSTVVDRTLFTGVASLGDCPLVRGQLVRIQLDTLAVKVKYLAPEHEVGGGIWGTPAVDASTNTVFITTGTGEQDPETGMWGGTLMAADAATLEPKAHYFLPSNSLENDIEWGSSPTLFTASDGTPMTASTGKDGVLYANRQDDLSLAWTTKLAVSCIAPEQGCGSISTPAFDGRWLYVGAGVADPESFDAGSVYAVRPDDGQVMWMRPVEGTVLAPVTLAGGLVLVPTLGGLRIFDSTNGDPVWDDGGRGAQFGQAVVSGGTIYSTYVSGEVVAWRPPSQP